MTEGTAEAEGAVSRLEEFARIVQQLPNDLGQPFIMAFVQRVPRRDIAIALGITDAELSARLVRALMHCRQSLSHHPDMAPIL